MSEERTSTYINTYILPKGLDYSLFIFPHSFNGYFLDVVFLELQHHMNNQVIETENIETWAKIIKMGSWAGQPFILKSKKNKPVTEDDQWKGLLFPPGKLQQISWMISLQRTLFTEHQKKSVQLQTRTTR